MPGSRSSTGVWRTPARPSGSEALATRYSACCERVDHSISRRRRRQLEIPGTHGSWWRYPLWLLTARVLLSEGPVLKASGILIGGVILALLLALGWSDHLPSSAQGSSSTHAIEPLGKDATPTQPEVPPIQKVPASGELILDSGRLRHKPALRARTPRRFRRSSASRLPRSIRRAPAPSRSSRPSSLRCGSTIRGSA